MNVYVEIFHKTEIKQAQQYIKKQRIAAEWALLWECKAGPTLDKWKQFITLLQKKNSSMIASVDEGKHWAKVNIQVWWKP